MTKLVYVTITMPDKFKKLLDYHSQKQFMKRSEFIRAAVLKYIEFLEREDPRVGNKVPC